MRLLALTALSTVLPASPAWAADAIGARQAKN
jgi:hypothetical protein